MKKNIIFSILLLLLVVFNIFIGLKLWSAIEDNDDFAPYTEKNFDVAYIISSDILSPSQLKNEVTPIAQNYEKNVKLTSLVLLSFLPRVDTYESQSISLH